MPAVSGLFLAAALLAGAASPAAPLAGGLVQAPDYTLQARLYHAGTAGGRDSLGCRPVAMRTVAVDPKRVPRRSVLFIAETVGMKMADGAVHDGYWYASDTGGGIKGDRIDLFTGANTTSMRPAMRLNLHRLSVERVGRFEGCPKA